MMRADDLHIITLLWTQRCDLHFSSSIFNLNNQDSSPFILTFKQ